MVQPPLFLSSNLHQAFCIMDFFSWSLVYFWSEPASELLTHARTALRTARTANANSGPSGAIMRNRVVQNFLKF